MKKELFGLCALLAAAPAWASCGAAFCSINTDWDIQSASTEPGLRADLRYEYIKQDQPLAGHRKIGVGEIPHHHDEVRTINRNWLASVDYTINTDWGINAVLPIVDREHLHIHNHGGAQLLEAWDFTKLGDMRVVARRRLATFEDARPSVGTLGVNLGLKLPTGPTDVRNSDGDLAERTLQPGSGTTDLLAGVYYSRALPMAGFSWFAQAMVQLPLNSHEDFRPGRRTSLDAGVRHAISDRLALMLQANAQYRGRDEGDQAEPADSGGTALFISPGASYAITRGLQVYGFWQLPVYQYANGVQLVARSALALGVSMRF